MKPNRPLLALAACMALAAAPAARAGDLLVTYVGQVTAVGAEDGLFGSDDASLVGAAFRADIVYSTQVPGTRSTLLGSDEVTGGLSFGTEPVISSATFTVDGASFSFTPDYYGDVYTTPTFLDAYGYDENGNGFQTYIQPFDGAAPANLETSFVDTGAGDSGGPLSQFSFVSDGTETVDFDATSVRVSAAPEPRTWALWLAGVACAGLALRRRRDLAATA